MKARTQLLRVHACVYLRSLSFYFVSNISHVKSHCLKKYYSCILGQNLKKKKKDKSSSKIPFLGVSGQFQGSRAFYLAYMITHLSLNCSVRKTVISCFSHYTFKSFSYYNVAFMLNVTEIVMTNSVCHERNPPAYCILPLSYSSRKEML